MRYIEEILILLAFSLPAYFFWRWLYSKFINDDLKRQAAIWLSTILISPLLYRGAIMLLLFYISYYPKIDFDRQRWLADPGKRYQMSENIVQSKMLIGKTKGEIQMLLGVGMGPNDHWAYYIGILPGGFSIDPDELDLIFENGKVVKVSQHQN